MQCQLAMAHVPQECGGPSALPLTMELVDALELTVRRFPQTWALHDRVLCLLDENMVFRVKQFYDSDGPSLIALFGKERVKQYDAWLLGRLLNWLKEYKPRHYNAILSRLS